MTRSKTIKKEKWFNINIKTKMKQVNFSNVTFNLESEVFQPYKKSNNALIQRKKFI